MLMLLDRLGAAKVAASGELRPVIVYAPGQERTTIDEKTQSTVKK